MVKAFNSILEKVGLKLNRIRAISIERDYLVSLFKGAVDIFNVHKKYQGVDFTNQIRGFVFSKDRAMQLHALLTSYIKNVTNYCPLEILYKATSDKSKRSYEELKSEFKSFPFVFTEENDFNAQVKYWLSNHEAHRIFFMTDDGIFLDSFDMNIALIVNPLNTILSLTKGYDLTYCFPKNVMQPIPHFSNETNHHGNRLNYWRWNSAPDSPGWSYPISLDGDFYLGEEMLAMVNNISFENPNSLEANLQVFIDLFMQREGACFDKVKLTNVPCNLVQNVIKNRSTGLFSAKDLQILWDKKQRINIAEFDKLDAYAAMHSKYSFISIEE